MGGSPPAFFAPPFFFSFSLRRKKRTAAASEEACSIPLPPGRRKLHIRSLRLLPRKPTAVLGRLSVPIRKGKRRQGNLSNGSPAPPIDQSLALDLRRMEVGKPTIEYEGPMPSAAVRDEGALQMRPAPLRDSSAPKAQPKCGAGSEEAAPPSGQREALDLIRQGAGGGRFDLGGLDAEDEAKFAEKQLLCHFPVAKLRRADAAAQRREALLLLIEGFAEAGADARNYARRGCRGNIRLPLGCQWACRPAAPAPAGGVTALRALPAKSPGASPRVRRPACIDRAAAIIRCEAVIVPVLVQPATFQPPNSSTRQTPSTP